MDSVTGRTLTGTQSRTFRYYHSEINVQPDAISVAESTVRKLEAVKNSQNNTHLAN